MKVASPPLLVALIVASIPFHGIAQQDDFGCTADGHQLEPTPVLVYNPSCVQTASLDALNQVLAQCHPNNNTSIPQLECTAVPSAGRNAITFQNPTAERIAALNVALEELVTAYSRDTVSEAVAPKGVLTGFISVVNQTCSNTRSQGTRILSDAVQSVIDGSFADCHLSTPTTTGTTTPIVGQLVCQKQPLFGNYLLATDSLAICNHHAGIIAEMDEVCSPNAQHTSTVHCDTIALGPGQVVYVLATQDDFNCNRTITSLNHGIHEYSFGETRGSKIACGLGGLLQIDSEQSCTNTIVEVMNAIVTDKGFENCQRTTFTTSMTTTATSTVTTTLTLTDTTTGSTTVTSSPSTSATTTDTSTPTSSATTSETTSVTSTATTTATTTPTTTTPTTTPSTTASTTHTSTVTTTMTSSVTTTGSTTVSTTATTTDTTTATSTMTTTPLHAKFECFEDSGITFIGVHGSDNCNAQADVLTEMLGKECLLLSATQQIECSPTSANFFALRETDFCAFPGAMKEMLAQYNPGSSVDDYRVICESLTFLASTSTECDSVVDILNQAVDDYLAGTFENCRRTTPTTSVTTTITSTATTTETTTATTTRTTTATTSLTTTGFYSRIECFDSNGGLPAHVFAVDDVFTVNTRHIVELNRMMSECKRIDFAFELILISNKLALSVGQNHSLNPFAVKDAFVEVLETFNKGPLVGSNIQVALGRFIVDSVKPNCPTAAGVMNTLIDSRIGGDFIDCLHSSTATSTETTTTMTTPTTTYTTTPTTTTESTSGTTTITTTATSTASTTGSTSVSTTMTTSQTTSATVTPTTTVTTTETSTMTVSPTTSVTTSLTSTGTTSATSTQTTSLTSSMTTSLTSTSTTTPTSTPTTTTTPTTPAPTCREKGCRYGLGDSCNCDALCVSNGDCCADFDFVCGSTTTTSSHTISSTSSLSTTSYTMTTATATSVTTTISTTTVTMTTTTTSVTDSSTTTTTVTETTGTGTTETTVTSTRTTQTSTRTTLSSTTTSSTFTVILSSCSGIRANTGERCSCGNGCHSCYYDEIHGAGNCTYCKSRKALFEGSCVERRYCVEDLGGEVDGFGKYGLECIVGSNTSISSSIDTTTAMTTTAIGVGATTVTQTSSTITTTSPDEIVCRKGKSSFDGEPCSCGSQCLSCTIKNRSSVTPNVECTVCRNFTVLQGGDCISKEQCITELDGRILGFGQYNLRCDTPRMCRKRVDSDGNSCTCNPTRDCFACRFGGVYSSSPFCTVCNNRQYLYDGHCINETQCLDRDGTPIGFGRTNKKCSCPDPLEQFVSYDGFRLKSSLAKLIGSVIEVTSAEECAKYCIAESNCQSFELRDPNVFGIMTCRLMRDTSANGVVTADSFMLYERNKFCNDVG